MYELNESKTAIVKDNQILRLSQVVDLLNYYLKVRGKYLEELLDEYGNQTEHDCLCDFIVSKIEGLKGDN